MKVFYPFSELKKVIEKSSRISKLNEQIEKLQSGGTEKDLEKKLFEYFKEILKFAQKNKDIKLKKLYDDLYWLQYTFCVNEVEEEWQISHTVRQFFFEFQKNLKPSELIKKIEALEKIGLSQK